MFGTVLDGGEAVAYGDPDAALGAHPLGLRQFLEGSLGHAAVPEAVADEEGCALLLRSVDQNVGERGTGGHVLDRFERFVGLWVGMFRGGEDDGLVFERYSGWAAEFYAFEAGVSVGLDGLLAEGVAAVVVE